MSDPKTTVAEAIASGDVTAMQAAFRSLPRRHSGGQQYDEEWEASCEAWDAMPESQGREAQCVHCGTLLYVFGLGDPECRRCLDAWGER